MHLVNDITNYSKLSENRISWLLNAVKNIYQIKL